MKSGNQASEFLSKELQDDLADRSGLAIVLADEFSSAVVESNNNSMCEVLCRSEAFASECEKFCGTAFRQTAFTSKTVGFKCHAGLNCLAVPIKKENRQAVAIVGRAFTEAEDYRRATSRAIDGDWQKLPTDELFDNVLFSNSNEHLEKLARKIEKLNESKKSQNGAPNAFGEEISANEISQSTNGGEWQPPLANFSSDTEVLFPGLRHWRSLLGSLLDLSYRQACYFVLRFVADRYSLKHLAWFERRENQLETIFANGDLKNREMQLDIAADDWQLHAALKNEKPLEMRERQTIDQILESPQTIWLFPIAVGGEVQSALVIGELLKSEGTERQIARFCRTIASELEILRLREQLAGRHLLERAVGQFNESLQKIDSDDFWSHLTNISAGLFKAERSSLLVFDEKSDSFVAKAATGIRSDFIKKGKQFLGERVSRNVLSDGEAVVVQDVNKIGLQAAPADWQYKSNSFISYPITIGARKIGVLNLTDRADGKAYGEADLELLRAIVPQLAVLIDRASLKHQAGEFEQLSVTDALTGLLNRRYLEERLTEEINRSNRHGFPVSFMMIDVDDFKSYNDSFGHTEGDKALQMVGARLKETLRGADVAARYGGEEFSILLPQTNSEEAAVIAERIREHVEKECFLNRRITISIGIASRSLRLNSPRELVAAADKALYRAKRNGRNNVQVYENLKLG